MYSEIDKLQIEALSPTIVSHEYKTNQCPSGFMDIDPTQSLPYCYKILDKEIEQMPWQKAKLICNKLGAKLTTINSPEENNYIFEAMKNYGINLAWIGLKKNGKKY